MARKVIPEVGLPSLEVRRRILIRAGVVLDEARALMAQLDQHENVYPRTACDQRRLSRPAAMAEQGHALLDARFARHTQPFQDLGGGSLRRGSEDIVVGPPDDSMSA